MSRAWLSASRPWGTREKAQRARRQRGWPLREFILCVSKFKDSMSVLGLKAVRREFTRERLGDKCCRQWVSYLPCGQRLFSVDRLLTKTWPLLQSSQGLVSLTCRRFLIMKAQETESRPERELRERRHEITSLLAVNRRTDERKAVSRRYFYSIPCYERHVND